MLNKSPVINTTVRHVKVEPNLDKNGSKPAFGGSDVIVISSDSESEGKPRVKKEEDTGIRFKLNEPTVIVRTKGKARNRAIRVANTIGTNASAAFDRGSFIQESGTVWTDSDITSFVIEGALQVTTELWVKRVEYLSYTPAAKYTPNSEFPTFYTYNYNSNVIYFMAVASTAEEYWNSESEDGYRSSYFDMINDVDLLLPLTDALRPTTIVADSESREVETSTNDNFNQAFDLMTASITASGDPSHNVNAATENTDMSWPSMASHSNSPSVLGTSAYNSDFMDTSDQSYPYPNMDYLAHFSFVPTAATHSSQPNDLFRVLPPPTQAVHSFHSNSPNIVPEDSNRAPHNLNKRLRISDFTEENILPDNERRKRSKPERLIL